MLQAPPSTEQAGRSTGLDRTTLPPTGDLPPTWFALRSALQAGKHDTQMITTATRTNDFATANAIADADANTGTTADASAKVKCSCCLWRMLVYATRFVQLLMVIAMQMPRLAPMRLVTSPHISLAQLYISVMV